MDAPADGAVDAVTNVYMDTPTKLDAAIVRTQAKAALVRLGGKSGIAQAAVAAAFAQLAPWRRSSG